jgi:hypothetical protein
MRTPAIFFFLVLLLSGYAAFTQVGVHTDFPDNSSAMDIVATNRGLLIPRVALTSSLSSPSPVTAPAVGLLVFNSGANQPIGFYYWNGTTWVLVGGGSSGGGSDWTLTGNAGTVPGTNFLGTTDNNHFVVKTNNAERIRFESDGQVIIGGTTPTNATDLLTIYGNSTQNVALSIYSPRTGFQTNGGRYGILSTVDTANGFAYYGRNLDPLGYGLISVGSNYTSVGLISGRYAGIFTQGSDGLHAWAKNPDGTGILAMGSNAASSFSLAGVSAGLSAVGNYGIIARGSNATGRGIVAIGSGQSSPSTSLESEGGAFTGHHGVYAKGAGSTAPVGVGVIGVGYNVATYSTLAGTTSVGGSFSGDFGIYSKGLATAGTGVIGVGSAGSGYYTLTNGSGGSFTGYHGSLSVGSDVTIGHGVVAAGNNSSYNLLPNGAGGSFKAINNGVAGFASSATGTGVVGAGNNQAIVIMAAGSGGSFAGTVCGVHGYAYNSSNDRYGGYFAVAGNLYAYVGGRYSGTNRKIVGTGTVSTIVKNRSGERITLTCPEAPESVFQDFGIGQLVNGFAHITIDPDLAININVSEQKPLKVYVTLEGDCKGVFVTNKSAEGFDVVELQGGTSNVPFSWQIVATRANEVYILEDGTIEVSDYSQRFQPAPGPLEFIEIKAQEIPANTESGTSFKSDQTFDSTLLEMNQDKVIELSVDPDE